MADLLVAALTRRPLPHAVEHLLLTDPIADLGRIDGVMFSGGVGEYVYGRESRDFGDMGRRLGQAIRRRIEAGALPWPLLPAGECIRATALGASEYSVQLSGNTSYISKPGELLPRRNLQVLQPPYACEEVIEPAALARAIRAHFTAFDLIEGEGEVALALRWRGAPAYERIAAFAEGIRHGSPPPSAQSALHHARRRIAQTLAPSCARSRWSKRDPGDRRRRAARLRSSTSAASACPSYTVPVTIGRCCSARPAPRPPAQRGSSP
jgi:ethanolamine utilization protein EutA